MTRYILVLIAFVALAGIVPHYFDQHPDHASTPRRAAQDAAPAADAAAERSTLPKAAYLGGGHLATLEANGQGHFTGRFELNGRRVDGIVDTGATDIAMNLSTARSIGLDPAERDFVYKVQTANGVTKAAHATIASVRVGAVEENNVDALILPDSAMPQTLIGMSFLRKLNSYEVHDGRLDLKE